MNNQLLQKKICMLGIFGVGKTSLTRRFVYDKFDDTYLSTIGVKISQKLMPPVQNSSGNQVQFNFMLWDIEGAENPAPAIRNYLLGSEGAIIVSDLTRMESIEAIPAIINLYHQSCPEKSIIVAGNKCDLLEDFTSPANRLQEIAAEQNLEFYLTSAKNGQNVEQLFLKLGLLIAK
ncbi:MAG: Rab family GTPase [Calditrichota bacterium]